ncbi:MAG: polyprenyl synthetase family protein [Candidatus Bathyarchaeota archaeon]|nr:polyprenyl synthetase family protein [Candidatus Bathyarchaeota archaeon]
MVTEKSLTLQAREILYKRGKKGLDKARQIMEQEKISYKPLQQAIQYFMSNWEDVIHPALLSLACEAVGGNPQTTTEFGAALVLLAGGADLHDDIIDGSEIKSSKPTVLGKFGKALTILAGDTLLFRGLCALQEALEPLSDQQKQQILEYTKQAFLEISGAEATETALHGKIDSADAYFAMIKQKSAVSEATTKIGAIFGGGDEREIEVLGRFGGNFGVLYTVRDEFIDIFDVEELKNRYEKESLPLPILFALKDKRKAEQIKSLLKKHMTEDEKDLFFELVLESKETAELKNSLQALVNAVSKEIQIFKHSKDEFDILLQAMLEDL